MMKNKKTLRTISALFAIVVSVFSVSLKIGELRTVDVLYLYCSGIAAGVSLVIFCNEI
jgi:uncharacterized protein YebE (UPF0316 family)